MTKLEAARKIVEQKGSCGGIKCGECPIERLSKFCSEGRLPRVAFFRAYLAEHDKSNRPTVGAYVRVTMEGYEGTGTIVEDDHTERPYLVDMGSSQAWCRESEVEPLRDLPAQEAPDRFEAGKWYKFDTKPGPVKCISAEGDRAYFATPSPNSEHNPPRDLRGFLEVPAPVDMMQGHSHAMPVGAGMFQRTLPSGQIVHTASPTLPVTIPGDQYPLTTLDESLAARIFR